MNLAPIVERLRSEATALKVVGGAAQYAQAAANLTNNPGAFVLPARDMPSANPFMNQVVEQVVPTEFAVVIGVRNLADATGAAAVDALSPVRASVRDALLGWTPDGAEMGCEFAGGELVDFINGVLWWNDTYRTQYTIRSA